MKIRSMQMVCFILLATGLALAGSTKPALSADLPAEIVIGWNDLGMHCMNRNYSSFCILPPYNNLMAQVVRRGSPPLLVTSGVDLTYSFTNNAYSSGKIDFWTYAKPLFGVSLAPDIGLTGKGLAGTLDFTPALGTFEASGVPLTPFDDTSTTLEQPYQLASVDLKTSTSLLIDSTSFVAPVSVEMHCDLCHGGQGQSTEAAILRLHDNEEGTTLTARKPVLCGSCHSSNALGTPGVPGLPSLSLALHRKHAEERPDIDCYACHPGFKTQCLRDAMYIAGKRCSDCHGNITQMALGLEQGRKPWLEEPRCETCHGAKFAEEPGKLYRHSKGHGGLYCSACHNSPHAILPTILAKDSIQVQRLQGNPKALAKCTICHTTPPTGSGPHGIFAPRAARAKVEWAEYR